MKTVFFGKIQVVHTLLRFQIIMLIAIFLVGCGGRARQLMPTPAVFVDAALSPLTAISPKLQSNKVDVLYVTDRNAVSCDPGELSYGWGRSTSMAFGSCVVEIGKQIGWQSLVDESTLLRRKITLPLTIQKLEELGRFPSTPYPLVKTDDGFEVDPDYAQRDKSVKMSFNTELHRRLELTPRKDVFVFIHGYNNVFDDSVFQIAELWHYLGRQGVPIAYSWPAGIGGLRGYTYDRESGEFTNYHIKAFLKMLAENPEVENIHLIAHSRGTDVTTTALRELFIEARAAKKDPKDVYKIANLILAAPDMDMEVVLQRLAAEHMHGGVDRLTIYVSPNDKALGFADWLFLGIKRLGSIGAADITDKQKKGLKLFTGISFINVSAHSGFIGHSYFHSNPSVSADLMLLLRDNLDPGAENGRPLKPIFPGFWELQKGYPKQPKEKSKAKKNDD